MSGSSTSRTADRPGGLPARRRVSRWLSVPLGVAVLGAGAWGVATSPLFRARTIEVAGASHFDRAQVLRLAGVAPGTNVLWLHTGDLERRLEANRWIASATVRRSLPSSLRITVTERTPAAEVKVGTRWALVAADGTVLDRVVADPGLPALAASVGDRRALAGSAAVVGAMTPWLRAKVGSVVPAPDGTVVLELSSGIRVLFGAPTDVDVKDQALAGILRWALDTDSAVGYVDLRAPLAPAVGPGRSPADTSGSPAPYPTTGSGG